MPEPRQTPGVREPSPPEEKLSLTRPGQWMRPLPESNGYGALNTMISGVLLFTLLGWLLGRWLDAPWIAGIGLVLGMASAFTVIWFRYGTERVDTSQASPGPEARNDNTKENK